MLEFDLQQGWTKGLKMVFENAASSASFNSKVALHIEQKHGDHIHMLSESDLLKSSPICEADGIYVQGDFYKNSKRPLLIKTADCVPLFLIDKETQALAVIHAGWRGLQKGIHTKLFQQGHLDPKNTWAWIGPSMNGKGFEVREDMWSQFSLASDPEIFEATKDPNIRLFYPWK
jgi:polyphenol oxidase